MSRKYSAVGLGGIKIILSFDCDTPEDAACCNWLVDVLGKAQVPPVLAVPGQMLVDNKKAYSEAAARGAVFINHGFLPHAEKRGDRYWSITFYSEMKDGEVAEDIRKGREAVMSISGRQPLGFRTPHFGHFQSKAQLAFLRKVLLETGHIYSSSTIPSAAFWKGPLHRAGGLWEFPVSGPYASPLSILDSWGHIANPSIPTSGDSYFEELAQPGTESAKKGMPILLNYYMDPAHLGGEERLSATISKLLDAGVKFTTYDAVLSELEATKGRT